MQSNITGIPIKFGDKTLIKALWEDESKTKCYQKMAQMDFDGFLKWAGLYTFFNSNNRYEDEYNMQSLIRLKGTEFADLLDNYDADDIKYEAIREAKNDLYTELEHAFDTFQDKYSKEFPNE